MEEGYILVDEVARLLQVRPHTVLKYRRTRDLPYHKIGPYNGGGVVRFLRSEILLWMQGNRVKPRRSIRI